MSIRIRKYIFALAFIGIAIIVFSMVAGNAKAAQTSPTEVHVCMGDSITAGAYLTNYDTYPGFLGRFTGGITYNSGVGGETTTQILARFSTDVLAHSPKYVFLMGGTNDVLQNVPAATIENNLATMINMASAAGATTFLLNIPPAGPGIYTSANNTEVAQVNAWIATRASANVILVDDHSALGSGTNIIPAYFIDDEEHPSALGMEVIAKTIVKAAQAKGIFTDVKFWTAAAAGSASVASNWAGGVAPVAGDSLVFDAGSVKNCVLNQALTYRSITTASAYTGILSMGANMGTTNDQVFLGGTFKGSTSYTDTCSGDFAQYGGLISDDVLNLIMAGSGKNLQVSSFSLYTLTFNADTYIVYDYAYVSHNIVIATGVTVTNYNGLGGMTWMPSFGGDTFTNNGRISGTGPLVLQLDVADQTTALGAIDCPATIALAGWAGGSRTLIMSASSTIGTLTVESYHSTYKITLDLAGHSLTASTITTSTRGTISSSVAGATINAAGAITAATSGTIDATKISTITCTSYKGAGTFVGSGSTAFIVPSGTTSIAASAFASCAAMSSVTVPSSVTSIGASAFSSCSALTSISFLGSVAPTSMGSNWIQGTNAGILGHAYATSNFPMPGNTFNGLMMGTVIGGITQYQLTVTSNVGMTTGTGSYNAGSTVAISAIAPTAGIGEQYVWNGWVGTGTGSYTGTANPASVTMNGAITETASWTRQYQLTMATNLGTTTPSVGSFWNNAGSTMTITATAPTGATYVFNGWAGTGTGSYTGPANPASVTMNGPITETASWTIQSQTQYQLTVTSNVGTTTGTGSYNAGSTVTISATAPTATIGMRYVFNGWVGTGTGSYNGKNNPASVTMNGQITETASWTIQYQLTVTSAHGTPTPSSGTWINSGTVVTESVNSPANQAAGTRYLCSGWGSGTGSIPATGSKNSVTFTITGPSSLTWNWMTQKKVVFAQSGIATGFSGTVLKIDGTSYARSSLPVTLWWNVSSKHTFQYLTPLTGTTYKYMLSSTAGVSAVGTTTVQNGVTTITVTGNGTITGSYSRTRV
jgi:lysophospholipase L1-like esterase